MLISVISVIVFVAGRLPVLLVTSRRWVMDRRDPGGPKKNNNVGFLWHQPIVEQDRQVAALLLELCVCGCLDGTLLCWKSAA